MDHSSVESYVIPGELAQLVEAQAERDRDNEQRPEPAVGFVALVQAELRVACTARRVFEFGRHVGDRCVYVRLVSARPSLRPITVSMLAYERLGSADAATCWYCATASPPISLALT